MILLSVPSSCNGVSAAGRADSCLCVALMLLLLCAIVLDAAPLVLDFEVRGRFLCREGDLRDQS